MGNRVVKSLRSDSSKSCFGIFCSIVYTPTKKKPYHEIPCYLPVFRYLPSKSKLRRKSCNFLAAKGSILNSNISVSVRILFNIFILVWKVFWSAFQWCILKYCQFSSFLVRGQNVKKTVKKSQKSNISGLAKESCTELQAENMLNVIFQGHSFQWKKIWIHLKPTS